MNPAAAERVERRAQAAIVIAMLAIAFFVGVEAVRALLIAVALATEGVRIAVRHRFG